MQRTPSVAGRTSRAATEGRTPAVSNPVRDPPEGSRLVKALPSQWLKLVGPYRSGDWLQCIEILRPVVEQYPDDLDTRLLFGALCVASEQGARALMQFEKIMPLAVGQGDLFRALAAQKQLDRLRPAAVAHDKRFIAVHHWFRSIPTRRSVQAEGADLTPAMLLALPPDGFHRLAEEAVIEDLGLEARDVEGELDSVRVVFYGRVRWSVVPEGEPSMLELVADDLDTMALAPGVPPSTRLRMIPELPSACLKFDLALLREEAAKAGPPKPVLPGNATHARGAAPETGVAPAPHARSAPPSGPGPTSHAGPPRGAGHAAPGAGHPVNPPRHESSPAEPPATPRPERPVPDPLLEPTVAASAPFERRRETRALVSLQSRAALLGLAGSRVAPFAGRLLSLSPSGAGLGFSRAELLPVRDTLENTLLTLEIQLPDGEPPLKIMSRVRWIQVAHEGNDMFVIGLEFILIGGPEHMRIQNALIAAARAGEPLDPTPIGPPGRDSAAA